MLLLIKCKKNGHPKQGEIITKFFTEIACPCCHNRDHGTLNKKDAKTLICLKCKNSFIYHSFAQEWELNMKNSKTYTGCTINDFEVLEDLSIMEDNDGQIHKDVFGNDLDLNKDTVGKVTGFKIKGPIAKPAKLTDISQINDTKTNFTPEEEGLIMQARLKELKKNKPLL